MKLVSVKLIGDGLDLTFSVEAELAKTLIRQLADATLKPDGGASLTLPDVQSLDALMKVSATYRPLARFFIEQRESPLILSFQDIERRLGQPLRPSARRHKAWWANTETHVQASAWLQTGYRTSDIQLEEERITFTRQ